MKKAVIILGAVFIFTYESEASTYQLSIKNQREHLIYSNSPFHLAISKGDLESVKIFISYGADVNKIVNNMTPLMVAARFNQVEIIKILLEKGADLSIENDRGLTALHFAEFGKSTEAISILKEKKNRSSKKRK
ncbi:MAG: ankyrin repeat domain-containing protein [Flavobacterium nitrogenifigens]|uniref:Ankyrin repeat-containing protein n=1 Tax=Flavobacterium nitrogenifigens TaxID=1617283 RepID=A0A521F2P4_9FLAO|nr:ankyrin repeat domain-containing protein [Flavobacterium nitrogenifigens]KAF2339660.1 ankyrin repeat domain-containing protein [Flavobacterium nitrogenifigens]MDQ8014524.1 ankyrin repeat domain-containing protein [Flavobacterium nitrogenifigens]SMO90443.1 Ankyrin repeat-containing protein [Flavobacterium nitrogenifigens]